MEHPLEKELFLQYTNLMDKDYWDNFYQNTDNTTNLNNCSSFACFCLDRFFKNKQIIVDLGCGNARDAKYFAIHHHVVYGLDQSINKSIQKNNQIKNLNLINKDFVYDNYDFSNKIDVFYSRFTIHSISLDSENYLIPRIYNHLQPGGLFCIEVRTTQDPKFGVGQHISDTTYFNDNHTRRFIDSQNFLNKTLSLGFKLKYFNEQNNLSIYKDDNPVLMRLILEK